MLQRRNLLVFRQEVLFILLVLGLSLLGACDRIVGLCAKGRETLRVDIWCHRSACAILIC